MTFRPLSRMLFICTIPLPTTCCSKTPQSASATRSLARWACAAELPVPRRRGSRKTVPRQRNSQSWCADFALPLRWRFYVRQQTRTAPNFAHTCGLRRLRRAWMNRLGHATATIHTAEYYARNAEIVACVSSAHKREVLAHWPVTYSVVIE